MEKSDYSKKRTWILLMSALAVYFFMRFFFSVTLPFLLAFLLVWKIYPRLSKIAKKTGIKETWLLGMILIFFCVLLIAVLYIPLSGYMENSSLFKEKDIFSESGLLKKCTEKYNDLKNICCRYVGEDIIYKVQTKAFDSAKSCFSFFTYIIIFLVSVLLFCRDFEKIKRLIDKRQDNRAFLVIKGVVIYVKAFLKSQMLIFLVLTTLIGIFLQIMKVEKGWLLALLAGTLDALPFIGTGIVLVPLSIWLFLKGHIFKALFCLILYGVCAITRELLEPKLIGKKTGIYPIVLFASIFFGMHLFGVGGIIKGPLSVVILYEIKKVLIAKEENI